HPEDRDRYANTYLNAFKKREPFIGEFRILNQDGDYRWLLTKGPPRFNPDGSFAGYISSSVDITDRKKAEKALEEKEQNLRNTIIQAPVAMCIFRGPDYVVELANERMFELWGKSAEQVMHKPIFEGLPEIKGQGFDALLYGVYTTGETFSAEGVPVTLPRNGNIEIVYVNFVYDAYKEADGSVSGILAIAVDVTAQVIARQKIEEVVTARTKELADANDNLQKSNAELAQFAYIASHDLQEPLRKISTFSQMLENSLGSELSSHSKNYLHKINSSASRMTTLIRDVLTYSELVKENEVFEEVNLNEIVENIKTDYDLLIDQKGAIISYKDLPTIDAIPLQMSQLFGNLIGNSLKFVSQDVKPVISITAAKLTDAEIAKSSLSRQSEYYQVMFSDNGIGFKKEHAEKIFDIFQRLHRKSEYEGTGIGLAMCKKIVLNHGGVIHANESSEAGAVFNVILPLKQNKSVGSIFSVPS
ncbi:MAG: PAS domain S-box protein, partial [Chitinophagaceae bacterium]|nr:PAS domain S-box protein [Chitinophagaceae bacterium]